MSISFCTTFTNRFYFSAPHTRGKLVKLRHPLITKSNPRTWKIKYNRFPETRTVHRRYNPIKAMVRYRNQFK